MNCGGLYCQILTDRRRFDRLGKKCRDEFNKSTSKIDFPRPKKHRHCFKIEINIISPNYGREFMISFCALGNSFYKIAISCRVNNQDYNKSETIGNLPYFLHFPDTIIEIDILQLCRQDNQ